MTGKLAALVTALIMALHTHVTVAAGLVIPGPALIIAAQTGALAVLAWLAVRGIRRFRSTPAWRLVTPGPA